MSFRENHNLDAKSYVLYHANCFDGMGAAYAAWTLLGDSLTEYIPVQYGSEPPEMESGSNVYIVDFSYKKDVLDAIRAKSSNLVVLDHHKTAAEDLAGYPNAVFDMTKSGAILAWEYFCPKAGLPKILDHIQDRDLWTWKLDGTKEVMAAMELYKKDFRVLRDLDANALLSVGSAKLRFDEVELANSLKKAVIATFPGTEYRCAFLNCNNLVSEVGNKLATELPVDFSLSYFIDKTGDVVFSLRSIGDFNVSALAKLWGGGGHKNAAGAKIPSRKGYRLLQQLYASASREENVALATA